VEFDLEPSIIDFVRPLYQDLDGSSRMPTIVRTARIARALWTPPPDDRRRFELLLLFHGLRSWLGKVGNRSRTTLALAGIVSDLDLHLVIEALSRLEAPVSEAERTLAAAMLIDRAGVLGLADRIEHARREGTDAREIAAREVAEPAPSPPAWMDDRARRWLAPRYAARRAVCEAILREIDLEDGTGLSG